MLGELQLGWEELEEVQEEEREANTGRTEMTSTVTMGGMIQTRRRRKTRGGVDTSSHAKGNRTRGSVRNNAGGA